MAGLGPCLLKNREPIELVRILFGELSHNAKVPGGRPANPKSHRKPSARPKDAAKSPFAHGAWVHDEEGRERNAVLKGEGGRGLGAHAHGVRTLFRVRPWDEGHGREEKKTGESIFGRHGVDRGFEIPLSGKVPMEIYLDKRAMRQIRLSAQDAVEEGDTETLREDILEAFTEEQVEEIERRLESGDFFEFLTDLLDEWSGDDVDELLELLDTQLGDAGVDLKFEKRASSEEESEEFEEDEEDDDYGDDEDEDDEDLDEDDEDEEEEEDDEDD